MSTASSIIDNAMAAVTTMVTTAVPFNLEEWQASVLWMLIVGFIIAFILAFAVGANDVANSFGTTVGAGTLTLKQACILASIFETLGAILLGAKVGATIRKGIIDVNIYDGQETLLMAGEISAMFASGLWQLIATFLKLPVSGTHSIVGATIGFSLVARGAMGVNWMKMGLIVGSWFLSPVLAGGFAAAFYFVLRVFIFQKDDPVRPGLIAMPVLYGCTIAINCFSVLFSGSHLLGFDKLQWWADILISLGLGIVIAILVQYVVVTKMRKSIEAEKCRVSNQLLFTEKPAGPSLTSKVAKLPTLLETISEKEEKNGAVVAVATVPVDGSGDGARGNRVSTEDLDFVDNPPSYTDSCNDMTRKRMPSEDIASPKTIEEAKQLRMERSKRSKSVGHGTSSVRIPPVLQLESKVLEAHPPVPSSQEVKDEIRRNFSEPAMINLTENSESDIYEVFINRNSKLITIHKKKAEHGELFHSLEGVGKEHLESSQHELDNILSQIPKDLKLEDPFEENESEDEGLSMRPMIAPVNPNPDPALPNIYSGAIEEGFRRLTSSQQNVIAIKIGESNEMACKQEEELTKDEIMEAKEGRMEVRKIFSFLQILTACFGAFAHGGNDVSNAIGPLIALYIIYNEGTVAQKSNTPLLILLYGGVGICVGLWVWGRRVIKTMGQDLTNLTPSRGFAIELMSAITVLAASNIGIPVSTTHCKVGAVVAVGWVRAREAVDWKIFRNIVLAWFVTVPISGGLSAIIFAIIRAVAGLDT